MAKKNFYVVKVGRTPGIYKTWAECEANTKGFPGATFKGFETLDEAQAYLGGNTAKAVTTKSKTTKTAPTKAVTTKSSVAKTEQTSSDSLPETYAFTDGSYNIVTKVYGFGGFLHYNGEDHPVRGHGNDPEVVTSRNVAGEVFGAITAMKMAISLGIKEMTLFYDYEGVEKWALKDWKTNKPISIQYVAEFEEIKKQLKVNFCHVKAHTGIPGNEAADRMAKEEAGVE